MTTTAATATVRATAALAMTDDGMPPRTRMAVDLTGIERFRPVPAPVELEVPRSFVLDDDAIAKVAEVLFHNGNGFGPWTVGRRSLSVGDLVTVELVVDGELTATAFVQVLGCGFGLVDPLEATYLLA